MTEEPESGLQHMGARFYDPSTGAFLQTDPVMGSTGSPLSMVPYVYALNDPVNLIDPAGLMPNNKWFDKKQREWGNTAQRLQSFLNSQGFVGSNGRSLAVDGKYGENTRWAHWNYHFFREVKATGMHPEGMSNGSLCYRHFKESAKKALRQEFGGKLESITVSDLQRFLKKKAYNGLAVDGKFGRETKVSTIYFVFEDTDTSCYIPPDNAGAQVSGSQGTGNLKTAGPPPATIVGSNAWCHQQMERPKSAGEILDYNVNAVASAAMLYLGLKELAALDAALVSNRANSISAELNWSIVSKTGQTRAQHVGQHSVNNLQKQYYGVFYGNPVNVTNNAWAARGGLQPIQQGTVDVYNIPYANAGYLGGYASQGQNLNYVTVIVQKGTNNLITAYPSFGN